MLFVRRTYAQQKKIQTVPSNLRVPHHQRQKKTHKQRKRRLKIKAKRKTRQKITMVQQKAQTNPKVKQKKMMPKRKILKIRLLKANHRFQK